MSGNNSLQKPCISVITVVYNNETYIRQALESVLSQSLKNIEYIVIDGGSRDKTLDIIQEYRDKIQVLISEPDTGIYNAMNKGLKQCSGEIVAILNSDDVYADPEVLQRVYDCFHSTGADAVYGDLVYVQPEDIHQVVRYWKSGKYWVRNFLFGWMPPHPSFFLKTEYYHKFGLFDESLKSAADYELMLRMLFRHKLKAVWLPGVLVRMRTGGQSNISFAHRLKANQEDRRAWQINGLKPYFFTLTLKPLRKITQFIFKS